MNRYSLLRLSGVRYRCVPLCVPVDALDPLARLFLHTLEYESNVSRLLGAFDLPERVVEDILGHLVHRGYARFMIRGELKELVPVRDARPNVVPTRGEPFDLWQDDATGIVLPAWMVDPQERLLRQETRPGDHDTITLERGRPLMESFLGAPDSQIIDMLLRSDEQFRQWDENNTLIDRLVERYRVRPQTVWVEVVEADVEGRVIPQITSEWAPPWVSRVWSVALRRSTVRVASDEVAMHALLANQLESVRLVHGWRVTAKIDAWRDAVSSFLHQKPPPFSGYELRNVREQQSALAGVLQSVGEVDLLEIPTREGPDAWLLPVLEGSRDWVVLLLPERGDLDRIKNLLSTRRSQGEWLPSTLIVVVPQLPANAQQLAPDFLQAAVGPDRFARVVVRSWPRTGPAMAVGDVPFFRLRYAPASAVLEFKSNSFAAEALSFLQGLALPDGYQQAPGESVATKLGSLRGRREPDKARDRARLGQGGEAPTVAQALDALQNFGDKLLSAIVHPESLLSEAELDGTGRELDRTRSLMEQVPALKAEFESLGYTLSLSPAPPWTFWTRLQSYDVLPTFASVFTEPQRRGVEGEILLLANKPSTCLLDEPIAELLAHAVVSRRWTVTIAVNRPRDPAALDAVTKTLTALRARIPATHLKLALLRRPAPAYALVLDDCVYLAMGEWLDVVSGGGVIAENFGFVLECRDLARNLREFVQDNHDLLPGS